MFEIFDELDESDFAKLGKSSMASCKLAKGLGPISGLGK
jgi:hypothetical protein